MQCFPLKNLKAIVLNLGSITTSTDKIKQVYSKLCTKFQTHSLRLDQLSDKQITVKMHLVQILPLRTHGVHDVSAFQIHSFNEISALTLP